MSFIGRAGGRSAPSRLAEGGRFTSRIALGQGLFYLATGIWPLVNMRSFEKVTGPKVDKWLVKTVGVLVGVIGGSLIVAGRRNVVPPAMRLLAIGSALGLAMIELNYVARKRISPIYLADASLEAVLAGLWLLSLLPRRATAAL